MQRLSRADLESVLAFLGAMAQVEGPAPFAAELLEELERLVPSDFVGWSEQQISSCKLTAYGLSREAWWDQSLWVSYMRLDPAHRWISHSGAVGPVKYSDFLNLDATRRADPFVTGWLRPSGVRDGLVLSLPAPPGKRREITFDSFGREFSERDRSVLTVLAPHLATQFSNADLRQAAQEIGAAESAGLTSRQIEILGWVAHGKTNREVAVLLHLSTGTVRKHLDNIYAQLGVNRRAAAATMVFRNGQPRI